MPMTLRSCGRDTVPITGPRSRALAAPQLIGNVCLAPGAGCEVRRIWSIRFEPVIATDPRNGDGPPKQTGPVTNDGINGAATAARTNIAISQPNTTAIRVLLSWVSLWDASAVNFFGPVPA